jgi:23S rRNA (uracil1939-C5)-methyltransferase
LVYISCDPVTLSRDIGLISDTYEIKTVQPVDMFPNTMHVETVVSLSQRKSDEKIKVEVDGDALPVTKAESKATYEDIQKYIFDKYGLKVTSLDISRVKTKCGIKERKNYNLSKSNNYKQPGITDEKEEQILDALRLFKMV